MSQDRELAALKTLQELIWEEAYREGSLVAPVHLDVASAQERWSA